MSAKPFTVAIIGAGPAGLMAAEVLASAGVQVNLYDAMPSPGRKFLLAGIGGMNLTHSEAFEPFVARYREQAETLRPQLQAFDGPAVRDWAATLGIDTFVGTSGRVFPTDMKAAPLLRAWLKRLRELGVTLSVRHRWLGWNDQQQLCFQTPDGEIQVSADATVLALGAASWPRLGSDGQWLPWLQARGVETRPFVAANCGFEVAGWSEHLRQRFAGAPLKNIVVQVASEPPRRGEGILTEHGLEGSVIYAVSAPLRQAIERDGQAVLHLDVLPDFSHNDIVRRLSKPRGRNSLSSHLKRQLNVDGVKLALLHECCAEAKHGDAEVIARALKNLPITLVRTRPVAEAISCAGGVAMDALDDNAMLRALPSVFCAGEMLDWEAPTGGYLLTACLAGGRHAAQGVLRWLG